MLREFSDSIRLGINKKVIIFDFDGTIADSFPIVVDVINEFAEQKGLEKFSEQRIAELRDLTASQIFSSLNISKIEMLFFVKKFKKKVNEKISSIKTIKDITLNIHELKKEGNKLGIVTSNSTKNVKEFLKNNNADIFDFIYSDAGVFGKDKILKRLLGKCDIKTEDVLYIGDEVRDIEAAKKAGIKIVAVSWGYNSRKILIENNPDYIIDSPNELVGGKYEKGRS